MPFVYSLQSAMTATNFTTNGTTNTETDHQFLKPGSSRAYNILAFTVQGKRNAGSQLDGLGFRIAQYPTTSSSGGTAQTPNPMDARAPAAVTTCGQSASAGVSAGTGTLARLIAFGCGASGPGGWTAPSPDAAIVLDGGTNKSTDFLSVAVSLSLNFEMATSLQE